MKGIAIATLIGASAVIAAAGGPDALLQRYRELYPADPAQRQALDECFAQDPNFDRLDAMARQACYRHSLPEVARADIASLPHPAANFVDLWRAAGQGRMPANDVRAEEQNARYTRPRGTR